MRKLFLLIACILLLSGTAIAADIENELKEDLQIGALTDAAPPETRSYFDSTENPELGIGSILRDALQNSGQYWKEAIKTGVLLLLTVLLCTIVQLWPSEKLRTASTIAGVCAVTGCCAGNLKTMLGLGRSTILQFSDFSKVLLPSVAAAAAASGAPSGAAALSTATMFVTDLLITFQQYVLLPLIGIYVAISAACCASDSPQLDSLTKGIPSFFKQAMKILLLAFSAYLTITGVVSGTVDSLSLKAAKLTVSSTVPVIGSMLSDATESVLVSAKYLKNSIGLFGMLSVLAIGIVPFLQLGIHYLVLQATAFLTAMIDQTTLCKFIRALGEAMGFLLALTGACAFLIFFSCIAFIRVVVP